MITILTVIFWALLIILAWFLYGVIAVLLAPFADEPKQRIMKVKDLNNVQVVFWLGPFGFVMVLCFVIYEIVFKNLSIVFKNLSRKTKEFLDKLGSNYVLLDYRPKKYKEEEK